VVLRAALAGALSALASALAEKLATDHFGEAPAELDLVYLACFWGVVGGVTAVAVVAELLFLYRDSLEGVHRLSVAAGLRLFEPGDGRAGVAEALARAALELPNPLETEHGIDPHREVSKARILAASLLYKAKVGLTSFLLKLLLRRLLTRAALRVWLVFAGVPVTAIWNAIVAFRVIREARIRAMGPSAANELTARLMARFPEVSPEGGRAALRAVGACVVSSLDFHPNHEAMLIAVRQRVGAAGAGDLDLGDRQALLVDLRGLQEPEQRLAVSLLGVSAVLDGRVAPRERKLYLDARAAIGLPASLQSLLSLRRAFVEGRPVSDEELWALADR
jgi:hypothetical protein